MLGHYQDAQDSLLVQKGEQLVHLHHEKLFGRHGIHIAVQAVYHHHPAEIAFHALANVMREIARR